MPREVWRLAGKRLALRLQRETIPYAMLGALAVRAHEARPFKEEVEVLLTSEGLDQFREKFVSALYEQVPNRSRRFVERQSGVTVEVKLTGHYPGRTSPGPFPFPHPADVRQQWEGIYVASLPRIISLKLAAATHADLADVVSLTQAHDLDESFLTNLHPLVQNVFLQCLDEKRREEHWLALNG
jgi:hypothetical protein